LAFAEACATQGKVADPAAALTEQRRQSRAAAERPDARTVCAARQTNSGIADSLFECRPARSASLLAPAQKGQQKRRQMTGIAKEISALAAAMLMTLASGCASTPRMDSRGEYEQDTRLTSHVKAALLNEPTLKSDEIKVDTHKGVVRLSGFVRSTAEEDTAVAIARGVAGV
jgi:osmotically-inducible protein OsmY